MLLFEDTSKKEIELLDKIIKNHNTKTSNYLNNKKPLSKNDAFSKIDASNDAVAILRKSQYSKLRKMNLDSLRDVVVQEINLKKGILPAHLCCRNILI